MNQKQFTLLLALVVVLGLIGWQRWRTPNPAGSGGSALGQKLLGDFPINDVREIRIKQGEQELTLARRNDIWRVVQRNDYPANFTEISTLLLKLKDLKALQSEPIGASQLARMELAVSGTNHPVTVAFLDAAGKSVNQLTLGKQHLRKSNRASMDEFDGGGVPDGRYVQVGTATDRVILVADSLTELETSAGRWLDKNYFRVEKPKSITVTFAEAGDSWTLTRETESAEWQLANSGGEEKLDAQKILSVTSPFSSPSFDDVIATAAEAEAAMTQTTTLVINTFEGFSYQILLGAKQDEQYALRVAVTASWTKERTPAADETPEAKAKADEEFATNLKRLEDKLKKESAFKSWTYRVPAWSVDQLLKKRGELLVSKSDPASSAEEEAPTLPDSN